MNIPESIHYSAYFELQERLNQRIAELEKLHAKHLTCKNKCSECCMSFGLLPIEFYAIAHSIQNQEIPNSETKNLENCKFLINSSCYIYTLRPFICRTQGLPNVYYIEENEAWDLSVCELNFIRIKDSYFTQSNCLNMDEYNISLYVLNEKFLQENPQLQFGPESLLNINGLVNGEW